MIPTKITITNFRQKLRKIVIYVVVQQKAENKPNFESRQREC